MCNVLSTTADTEHQEVVIIDVLLLSIISEDWLTTQHHHCLPYPWHSVSSP